MAEIHKPLERKNRQTGAINEHRTRQRESKPQIKQLQEIIDEIDSKLRTKNSRIAFNNIKKLSILHPQ